MTTTTAWTAGRTAWLPPAPRLDRLDDIVVGGDVVGLSTAIELARLGRDVAVVEAHTDLFDSNAARSTGKLTLLAGTQLSTIARRRGPAAAHRYADRSREARAWVEPILRSREVPVDRRPAVTWAQDPSKNWVIQEEHAIARRSGLPTELLDSPPDGLPGGTAVLLHDQLQVDPAGYVQALADEAIGAGVDIHLGQRVQRLRRGRERAVVVATDRGLELCADSVVIATGLPIVDRSATFAMTKANRSYSVAFEPGGRMPTTMAVTADSPSVSIRCARVSGREVVLVGGFGHEVGHGGDHRENLDRLRRWAAEHLDVGPELVAWSAQDHISPDGQPIVGRLVGSSAIHVATGFSKWGLLAGVAAGRRLAAGIARGESLPTVPSTTALNPGSLGTIASKNGMVMADMAVGWIGAAANGDDTPSEGAGVVSRGVPPRATSTVDGRRRSVSAVCTHLGGVVRWNEVEQSWDCPLHGSRFAPCGRVLDGPAVRDLSRKD